MTKYKIIVLGVQGANNKVYTPKTETKHGKGIVSDDMFPEGNAEKLAKEGKLKKLSDPKQEAKDKADRIKALKQAVQDAQSNLDAAKEAKKKANPLLGSKATDEENAVFQKTIDDCQLALEIAQENLEKAG